MPKASKGAFLALYFTEKDLKDKFCLGFKLLPSGGLNFFGPADGIKGACTCFMVLF